MNSVLYLSLCLASVCLSYAGFTEYKEKGFAAWKYCAKQFHIDPDSNEPSNYYKCVAGCFYTKMGFITEASLDRKTLEETNPNEFQTPELAKIINQIADDCAKKAERRVSDLCDISSSQLHCAYVTAMEADLLLEDRLR